MILEREAYDSDLTLLDRYRDQGDQVAFAEIVRRYASAVFSTCMRIVGDRARADDISQETFFRLSQKPHMVKQSLGGWLHTAATRLAIDVVRSETSRAQREAAYEPKPPSEAVKWSDVSPRVDEALAELPDEMRVLLVRHFLQQKTQCQVAAEMKTSPATVSRKIKAAVEALRERLAKKGVAIAALALIGLLRENGAQAAPAELMMQLGKITMLSGGKPMVPAATPFKCAWWWVGAIGGLAVIFALLVWLVWPEQTPQNQPREVEQRVETR
jgi:RNA polymerase sigma factor (sigma-70 family)